MLGFSHAAFPDHCLDIQEPGCLYDLIACILLPGEPAEEVGNAISVMDMGRVVIPPPPHLLSMIH